MLDFHRELLADSIRTNAYRDAIRRFVTPESVVVDVGSGTGILSLFACEAGARRVYAIEQQHSADVAMLLARHSGYADRMTVIHEKSTAATLPEPADILVTETIGGFGLDEGIVSTVIDARRFLKPDAIIMRLWLAAVDDPRFYDEHVTWWSDRHYGFDLSPLRLFASNELRFDRIDPATLLSAPAPAVTIDFATVDNLYLTGTTQLTIERPGTLHGFAGWFSIELAPGLELSNECGSPLHWYQAFMALERPMQVERGTRIDVEYQSHDGAMSRWRGTVDGRAFDQMTRLSRPPCFVR
jgi:protein arginine N-methyltransferase 1